MPPGHDHFSSSVNLDDAEPVMRELVSPIPAGLGRMPGRETGEQASWIVCQPRKLPQLSWLVRMRPQSRLLAGLTADQGTGLSFALVPYHPAEQAPGTR